MALAHFGAKYFGAGHFDAQTLQGETEPHVGIDVFLQASFAGASIAIWGLDVSHTRDDNPNPPIAIPYLSPVFGNYNTYGYISVQVPSGRAGKGLVASQFTTVEAVLGYSGVYAEKARFNNGTYVYRIPVRHLSRCERDGEGYFIAWARVKYRIVAIDPSPAGRIGDWTTVF